MKKSIAAELESAIENHSETDVQRSLATGRGEEFLSSKEWSSLIVRSIEKIESCYMKYNHELEVFRMLLQKLVSLCQHQHEFDSALTEAALLKCLATFKKYSLSKWFLDIKNEKGNTFLYFCRGSKFQKLREELEKQCPSDEKSKTVFWEKIKQVTEGGRSVQDMFRDELPSNNNGLVDKSDVLFIRYLFQNCEVGLYMEPYRSMLPLHAAVRQLNPELVKLMITEGYALQNVNDVDGDKKTLFSQLARSDGGGYFFGNPAREILDFLISKGLEINLETFDHDSWLYIMRLGSMNNFALLKEKIRKVKDIDSLTLDEEPLLNTLAHFAYQRDEYLRIIDVLISLGANPNLVKKGSTPLWEASGSAECYRVLLKWEANPNVLSNGYPSFHAVFDNIQDKEVEFLPVIKLLVDNGANLFLKNMSGYPGDNGEIALDYAKRRLSNHPTCREGREAVINLLISEMKSRITKMRLTLMCAQRFKNSSCFFGMPKDVTKMIANYATAEYSDALRTRITEGPK